MHKLVRITTIPNSLRGLLTGQLKFMSENGFEVIGIASPGTPLEDIRSREGVRTIGVSMTRKITPIKDLKALYKLIGIFRKERPDIVHTHTPKAGFLGMLAAKITGVPHRLHTVSGLPLIVTTGVKHKMLMWVEKLTYACATRVYPNSFRLRQIILDHKFTSADKLEVIGKGSSNGIDTAVFDPTRIKRETKLNLRNELGIDEKDFVFLFAGRMVRDKGVNELVRAFEAVQRRFEHVHLVLAGSFERHLDPLDREVEKQIADIPRIHAVGYKTNVFDYFAIANVFVFPSYREGFPNVVMEAAAMCVNCIVTDINGCNEIIEQGKNGWIVPVKDEKTLAERMIWCLHHREESEKMGRKSRAIMQADYERTCVWKALLEEYRKNLNSVNHN